MITRKKLSPFLRWAGGKVYIIHKLIPFVPEDYVKRGYREKTLGTLILTVHYLFFVQPIHTG
jgi:hypothetical protein